MKKASLLLLAYATLGLANPIQAQNFLKSESPKMFCDDADTDGCCRRGPPGPRGPQGIQGPVGPPGASPFISDLGSVLSFAHVLEPGGVVPAGSILIPFVSFPNGVVVQGTPIVSTGAFVDYTFSPIFVPNPIFGTYHSGVQVTLAGDFSPGLINLTTQEITDRAGPPPAEITLIGETEGLSSVFLPLLAGNQYQVMTNFVYGPMDIP